MQSLMGETTAVAHGGNPQDRTASPRPRCIAMSLSSRTHREVILFYHTGTFVFAKGGRNPPKN
ncbi:hypothetical protein [Moorena producens]|uniref:hypothetical protein n=1 Tax=Moorena producens TaxID=1155739 RepID=UPI000B0C7FE7|nr:hypothetical protein [Moorena producens]